MWFALAAILMLFMGLTSAYVVRSGLDPHWQAIPFPRIALANTMLLITSSVTLEAGRRSWAARWFVLTWTLGLAFLAGQLLTWTQLAAAGLYLSTNPHASFFYVLTALHGMHLLGGIAALSWLLRGFPPDPGRAAVVALYWHFLGVLWVYILIVLFAWN
jgi:cytochrome c oxidase subunit 3